MSAVEPSPLEEASALVERWDKHMGHGGMAGDAWIVLTTDVKRRMAREIVALINDTVHRERYTAS